MRSRWQWDYNVPIDIVEKMIPREIPTPEDDAAYNLAEYYGLYDYTCDTDDPSNSALRRLACTVSSSVVGVSSFGLGFRPHHSSGIIVEYNGRKVILTTWYILGDGSRSPNKITVILWNKKEVSADVIFADRHHNVVILSALLDDETTVARFSTDLRKSGTSVTAVGRHYQGRLMASSGTINNRDDHLESDDLMSSTSNISEWGIGGPLVDKSGNVLGMNLFSKKGYTPFMPSNILSKCVIHLFETGCVNRPWLGLRTRIQEPEGIAVKEVTKGTPADMAGICVDDLIISCNKTSIKSPAQFAEVLIGLTGNRRGDVFTSAIGGVFEVQFRVKKVEDGSIRAIVLPVERFSPPVPNSWPVLPIPKISGEANLACFPYPEHIWRKTLHNNIRY